MHGDLVFLVNAFLVVLGDLVFLVNAFLVVLCDLAFFNTLPAPIISIPLLSLIKPVATIKLLSGVVLPNIYSFTPADKSTAYGLYDRLLGGCQSGEESTYKGISLLIPHFILYYYDIFFSLLTYYKILFIIFNL